ncbi:MAG: ShlB/FhaC/HecB family hemolysin secretion/activation protein [Thermodesulfobacteriota bacterium]
MPEMTLPTQPRPTPPTDQRRIQINRFDFNGNTLFSDDELRTVIADKEGSGLTLTEIYGLADRVTEFYQSQGYSLTTVTVPAQRMQDGVLRLEVVEGKIGKVKFSGNQRYEEAFLTRHLDQLPPGAIMRFKELESEILKLNDLPGLTARSVLEPGDAYGTTDLTLRMEEKPVTASAVLDNTGRKMIGRWKLGTDLSVNNPFKYGDVLGLGYTHSEAGLLHQARVSYGLPVFYDGTRLNLSYARADYDVGGDFAALGIAGVSETARAQLSHPFLRSRRNNLSWTIGAAHVLGQSDMNAIPLSDDTIDYFETGLTYSHRNFTGGLSTLSALVASNFKSNSNGDDNAALPPRLELHGDYEYLFWQGWSWLVRGEAVLSDDSLPDSNKYSLGGPASVRGFVSSRLRGDRGALGALELRRTFSLSSVDLLLRTFIDAGEVYYDIPMADGSRSDSLASAGAGMTVSMAGKYSVDLQWAAPIDGNDTGDDLDSPLWLTVTAVY